MAGKTKRVEEAVPGSNYEKVKDEIITLVTGHDPESKEDFDYVKMLKRVTLLLIAAYGIGRVAVIRRLAISIATTMATKWLAEKATAAMAEQVPTKARS